MANNLIPEELNALIQEYLTDGVLSKNEVLILRKTKKTCMKLKELK